MPKKLAQRSETERSLARDIVNEFRGRLESVELSEAEMDHYGRELMEVRDRIEALQADAKQIPKEEKISDIVNENYRALEDIEATIRATKMVDPKNALAELKYGTGPAKYEQAHVVNVGKMKEIDLEVIAENIKLRYGAHPEDLKSGNVPGLKGFFSSAMFRMRDRFAHLAGQSSEYDEYRQALTLVPRAALKKKERKPTKF